MKASRARGARSWRGGSGADAADTADALAGAMRDERQITDLSTDELGLVLRFLPDAEDIAGAASVCKSFKLAVRHAAEARIAAALVPLPTPLVTVHGVEPRLRALRWAEAVSAKKPATIAAGAVHSLCISPRNGTLWSTPWTWNHQYGPQELGAAQPRSLSASHLIDGGHSLVLATDGAVWNWGDNQSGQLGHGVLHGDEDIGLAMPRRLRVLAGTLAGTRILQVAAGGCHSLLLTAEGGVLAFGENTEHQLGVRQVDVSCNRPIAVTGFDGRRVVEVAAGHEHSAAVDEAGVLWTWGSSGYGLIENADVSRPTEVTSLLRQRVRHVSAGDLHTMAVTKAGALWAAGPSANHLGIGTVGPLSDHNHAFVQVAALAGQPVRMVSAGGELTVVLSEAGDVYTMGDGDKGQLGHGNYQHKAVPTLVAALVPPLTDAQVDALDGPGLAREIDRRSNRKYAAAWVLYKTAYLEKMAEAEPDIEARDLLKMMRKNFEQLGYASRDVYVPGTSELAKQQLKPVLLRKLRDLILNGSGPVVEVSAGFNHALARTADGKIFSWGCDEDEQLGHDVEDLFLTTPTQIMDL